MSAVLASTICYALGRELGFERARAAFAEQLAAYEQAQAENVLPVVKTLIALKQVAGGCYLHTDFSGSALGKARSRAAHAALVSRGASVWFSCDDDVELSAPTIGALFEGLAGEEPPPLIRVVPCWLRERAVVNVALRPGAEPRDVGRGVWVVDARAGGFGAVAVTRAALRMMGACHGDELTYMDDDRNLRIGFFHEHMDGGVWLNEDLSFFLRARQAGVRVEALLSGTSTHGGNVLELPTVLERMTMRVPDHVWPEDEPAAASTAPASEPPPPPASAPQSKEDAN